MANENAPIGQINPANLIGQFKPQTDATSNFVQAMRAGVINANDIVQGIDRHQQAKVQLSAQQLALAEASNPTAMAARQAQNELSLATSKAALPLVQPLATAKQGEAMASIWGAQLTALGSSPQEVMQQNALGANVPMDFTKMPDSGLLAMIKANRDTIQKHGETGKYLGSEIEKGTQVITADGTVMQSDPRWVNQNRPLTPGEADAWNKYKQYSNPFEWDRAKRPGFDLWKGVGEGQFGTAAAPAATKATGPWAAGYDNGPVVAPRETPGGNTSSPVPGVRVTQSSVEKLKPLTQSEQAMGIGLARMIHGEGVQMTLADKGYDAGKNWSWAQRTIIPDIPIIGDMITQDTRKWKSSSDEWAQGLLRIESGAAIAYKEQRWYEKTFFPQRGDGPEVQAQKLEARLNIMKWFHQVMVHKLGSTGDLQANYMKLMDEQAARVGVDATVGGYASAPPSVGPDGVLRSDLKAHDPARSKLTSSASQKPLPTLTTGPLVSGGMQYVLNPNTGKWIATPTGK